MFRLGKVLGMAAAALLASGAALAQHHGGHGGHIGGAGLHMGGVHPGTFHHGGGYYHNGGYYHGGAYYGGIGIGNPYYGRFGYPYYGRGLTLGLGYGGLGYGGLGYGYGLGGLGYGYGLGGYGFGINAPGYGYNVGGYGYIPYRVSAPPYRYIAPAAPAILGYPAVAGSSSLQTSPNYGSPNYGGTVPSPKEPTPATVTVIVPEGAELSFNGKDTGKTGGNQVFTSDPIEPGKTMNLAIKAKWDGRSREMQLPMRAGDKMTVDLRGQ